MIRAVVAKELKVLWTSPLPYLLGVVFHATLGVLGWGQIEARGQATFQPLVPIAGFLILLAAPVLTSRTLSEEIRTGSLEVLLATRVPVARLAVGKFAASLATLLLLVAPLGLFAVLLAAWGEPDRGPILAGFVGLILFAAALTAVGVLASSLTSSQPTAAVGGLFVVLLLWFAHAGFELPAGGSVVGALSVSERLRGFAGGVIDSSDVVFFVSVVAAALAGTVVSVSARRWR